MIIFAIVVLAVEGENEEEDWDRGPFLMMEEDEEDTIL